MNWKSRFAPFFEHALCSFYGAIGPRVRYIRIGPGHFQQCIQSRFKPFDSQLQPSVLVSDLHTHNFHGTTEKMSVLSIYANEDTCLF